MRKIIALLVVLCGLAIPAAALAVEWDDRQNQDLVAKGAACEDGDAGAWYHFVNNQTDGAAAGLLTVDFDNPDGPIAPSNPVGPLAVNKNVQHFYVWAEGTLDSASTNLPGRLVISGVECGKPTDSPRDLFD